jgi:hypothetical protein
MHPGVKTFQCNIYKHESLSQDLFRMTIRSALARVRDMPRNNSPPLRVPYPCAFGKGWDIELRSTALLKRCTDRYPEASASGLNRTATKSALAAGVCSPHPTQPLSPRPKHHALVFVRRSGETCRCTYYCLTLLQRTPHPHNRQLPPAKIRMPVAMQSVDQID